MRARARAVGLTEALEDVRQEARLDALARCRATAISTASPPAAATHRRRGRLGRELDRVREQVPDHLLQPLRVAETAPRAVERRPRARSPWPRPPARAASTAASTTASRSTGCTSSRSLPVTMRETSSRSSMSCVCARALRSMTSRPRARVGRVELRRPAQHARPAEDRVSGVRSSWESVARNSSLSRFASRASSTRLFSIASEASARAARAALVLEAELADRLSESCSRRSRGRRWRAAARPKPAAERQTRRKAAGCARSQLLPATPHAARRRRRPQRDHAWSRTERLPIRALGPRAGLLSAPRKESGALGGTTSDALI